VDSQGGQAAVEWVGLLLLALLVLGALLAVAPKVEGRSLGGSLARAITCTAGGHCAPAGADTAPGGLGLGLAFGGVVPRTPAARGAPRRARRWAPRWEPRRAPRPSLPRGPVLPDRAAAAFHALRGLKQVAARAWIVCLGYKRFQYERAHPEVTVTGRMPVGEALRIANACLNPLEFVGEDE
jgi:hypothetical protein